MAAKKPQGGTGPSGKLPKSPKSPGARKGGKAPLAAETGVAVAETKTADAGDATPITADAYLRPQSSEARPQMGRATIPPELHDEERCEAWELPTRADEPGAYMIEINLLYRGGLEEAAKEFERLHGEVLQGQQASRPAVKVAKTYFSCNISMQELLEMVRKDEERESRRDRVIYRVWPDFPVKPLIDRSVATIKADAAVRSYAATGAGIIWAVIDSGIDQRHGHFGNPADPDHHTLLHPDVAELHRDFTGGGLADKTTIASALTDEFGHGTHVAGIIAGQLPATSVSGQDFQVYERVAELDPNGAKRPERIEQRKVSDPSQLRGVAPHCRLISLKTLDDAGAGRSSNLMRALEYVREELNGDPKMLRVHGVNISIGYEFDAEMFACGQSPLCVEVDRLVKSGVVVVVAAGNTGYGRVGAQQRQTKVGLSNTINDPGNAALSITVGATHRDSPHIYGVSYFSSKGPTGDGRLKPDLVAPGERITSCAIGKKLASQGVEVPDGLPTYIDDTGTSMAAPHVSGAIAAFLSIRREYIQRPEEVKRVFLESATPLGRERYFEGHGLLDLMRAIQSV